MDDNKVQPSSPAPLVPTQPVKTTDKQDKPKLEISDSEAEALLAAHNLKADQQPKGQHPTRLLIVAATLIILAILTSYLLDGIKPANNPKSSSSSSGQGSSSQNSGSSTSNQINQDVKSCANVVNAVSEC